MITREEYHKKIRKEHQQKINNKTYHSTTKFDILPHKSNVPDSKIKSTSNPLDIDNLSNSMVDGFHQVINVCMHVIKYCWKAINNISFIHNYNQKQTESFKRDQKFMESRWNLSHNRIVHREHRHDYKPRVTQPRTSQTIASHNDIHKGTTHQFKPTKSVPLDKPFIRMMQRK